MRSGLKRILFFWLCLLPLCAVAETRVMVVSDIHHLAPELWEGSGIFLNALSKGDGKVSQYTTELVQALADEALSLQPDLLLITGDLTFNGERESHTGLAELLRPVTEAGIRVAVIPGNHDINNRSAVQWLPNGFRTVDSVDSEAFGGIWEGMTADEPLGPGFSGTIRLGDVWIAVGDYSIYEYEQASNGAATSKHIDWLRTVLEEAREQGVPVISASHQSLLGHTDFHDGMYRVLNGDRLITMLTEAGSVLNLSGHLHLQHITSEDGFTDIAAGSFSMFPHRYGLVTVEGGRIRYEARSLSEGRLSEDFLEESRAWFRGAIMKKLRPTLERLSLTEDEITALLTYAADLNEARFSGTLAGTPVLWTDPAREMWQRLAGETMFARSIESTLNGEPAECLMWVQP